jgi:hypothetical protein
VAVGREQTTDNFAEAERLLWDLISEIAASEFQGWRLLANAWLRPVPLQERLQIAGSRVGRHVALHEPDGNLLDPAETATTFSKNQTSVVWTRAVEDD